MNFAPFGNKIIILNRVDSTNNYVAKLISEGGIEPGTVVLAENQVQGKGQRGSSWQSEPGKNLTASLYIQHKNISANQQFKLSAILALAMCEFLNQLNITAQIKWPNDILVDKQKICGLLIENQLQGAQVKSSIIGIGLNVNQIHFEADNITSVKQETHLEKDVKLICLQFFQTFYEFYNEKILWNYNDLIVLYYEKLYGFKTSVPVIVQSNGKKCQIQIQEVLESGLIKAEFENGKSEFFDLKELKFILQS